MNFIFNYLQTPQQNYGQQQQQQQQQQQTHLHTNLNLLTPTTTTVSLHSPPSTTTTTTTTNLTNAMNNPDNFQQLQPQQPLYYMFQEGSLDVDAPMEYEGHVSHTAQAAPITGSYSIVLLTVNSHN